MTPIITQIWDIYKKYLDILYMGDLEKILETLPYYQAIAYTNIIFSVFILSNVYNIVTILFGDYLINRFRLKEKHRYIAWLLRNRAKVKNVVLIIDTISIFFFSIIIIYLNYIAIK